jgi:uncharacterized membrane protein
MLKKAIFTIMVLSFISLGLTGCATYPVAPSKGAYQGGTVGAGVGAAAGALIDRHNRWRGGVIGAGLGAVLGGAMGEISTRAAQEAAAQQRPVAYTNETGTRRVEVDPNRSRGNCHIVTERHYDNGQLIKEVEREVCQ